MAVSTWPRAEPARRTKAEPDATNPPGTPRTPILVDATGHRRRAVRGLTFLGTLAFGGLLLAVPVSLIAPEHLARPSIADASTTVALRGTIFVDQDCDMHRSIGEPLVGTLRVELIRAGQGPIATTRTDSTGHFAFENIATDVDYDILVSTDAPGAETALYTQMPDPTIGAIDFALQAPTCAPLSAS